MKTLVERFNDYMEMKDKTGWFNSPFKLPESAYSFVDGDVFGFDSWGKEGIGHQPDAKKEESYRIFLTKKKKGFMFRPPFKK